MLVMSHMIVSEYVLMPWNKVKNKDDMVLHRFAQACATSSRRIFRNGSMQLTYVEVLHAKERLKKLNIDGNKLNLWRLWYGLNFRQSWKAMRQRRW